MITVLLVAVLFTTPIVLEEGAVFDGGICWEADGTEGFAHYDGQCITPADYDAIHSYENLSTIPVLQDCLLGQPGCVVGDDARSIAEVAGIEPDEVASDRPIGTGLVPEGEDRTFKERDERAHTLHLPVAA